MIDPVSAALAAEALAEITGSMTGMSMAQAYESKMTNHYEPYDPVNGLQIGYGNSTKETPAISGDTGNTFVDSSESDPQEAWLDWMHDGGSVSSTTGGAVIGSTGSTINYSLMADTNGNPQAVQPVGIELNTAVVAVAKTLGVAMKVSEVDPLLGGRLANALVAAGCVYDKAKNLFTCWWDGVNLLFPKKAAQALADAFDEEGIPWEGSPGGGYTSPLDTSPIPQPLNYGGGYSYIDGGGHLNTYTYDAAIFLYHDVGSWYETMIIAPATAPGGPVRIGTHRSWYNDAYHDDPINVNIPSAFPFPYVYQGKSAYYYGGSGSVNKSESLQIAGTAVNGSTQSKSGECAWTVLYGTPEAPPGEYPEGFSKSDADAYTPSTLVTAGAIAGKKAGEQEITETEVVPIALPENVEDTSLDDTDPVGATDPERTQENEKETPIPLPIPGTTTSNPEIDLVDSSVIPAEKIDELVGDLANTVDPQPPSSDGLIPIPPFMPGYPVDPDDPSAGSQYPTIVPSSGSGLIHVYNPTPAEFVAFGHWLWVTYADATIDKIWNNPFDGIIGAHELYATPGVLGSDNIRSGFLVCPTTAALVPNRYTEIDCGTVVVPEFYGNYLDYSPYSQCYIYLPFIGINEVSVDDIVGHAVNIRYRIDSYNGSCIAMIYVAKQGYRNLCYQFAGNCAVEVPLAGGSQAAIKAGMLQAEAYARATVQSAQIQKTAKIGTGIVGGAASGSGAGAMNPIAGIVGGLIGALAGGTSGYIQGAADYGAAKLNAGAMQEAARVANKSSVQHSGQFGSSHGAMGLKIPFIMIRNPVQVKVVNYNDDYGFPAHKRVIIGGCTGYLRVREVNVVSAHATNEEKIAIEAALKEGVYVT